jgi:hypothetical protein
MPLSLPQPSHMFPFPFNPPALWGVTAASARAVQSPWLLTKRSVPDKVPVRLKLLPLTTAPSKSSISAFSWRICISLMSLLPPQSTMTTVAVLTGLPHFPLNASTTLLSKKIMSAMPSMIKRSLSLTLLVSATLQISLPRNTRTKCSSWPLGTVLCLLLPGAWRCWRYNHTWCWSVRRCSRWFTSG